MPRPRFDTVRTLILIVLLCFFIFASDTSNPSLRRSLGSAAGDEVSLQIARERAALAVLNGSTWESKLDPAHKTWVNVTGLRKWDVFSWDALHKVQKLVNERFQHVLAAGLSDGRHNGTKTTDFDIQGDDSTQFYSNVTSIVRGTWVRNSALEAEIDTAQNRTTLNHTAHQPGDNSSALTYQTYADQPWSRNVSGAEGRMRFELVEVEHDLNLAFKDLRPDLEDLARPMKAKIAIRDPATTTDGWEARLFGVHYIQKGAIVLATTSEKFAGIFALPHFTLSKSLFDAGRDALIPGLKAVIDRQELRSLWDPILNPWTSEPDNLADTVVTVPHCELVVYLQQHPVAGLYSGLEEELRFPTGAFLSGVPAIRMTAVVFSPDCGFVLESKGPPAYSPDQGSHLIGKKIEVYSRLAKNATLLFALILCAQVLLIKRQMNEASTPSTKSRISFYTIATMALGDGFACMSFLVAGMFVKGLFLSLMATAFLSFLCVSFFGMKFLMDIWMVQAPERHDRERERERARLRAEQRETLPLPATARRPASEQVLITPDQDLDAARADDERATTMTGGAGTTTVPNTAGSVRRELGALYSRFYFLLLMILFLSLHATSWSETGRNIYCNVISFIYLSFWLPQIYRNIMRNCRKALSWRFVVGESIMRLLPILYFYLWEDNIFFASTSPRAALVLVAWVWLQVFALATQDAVGPRFFVPDGWVPPAYDYHPVLHEFAGGDEKGMSNLPVGFTESINSPTSPTVELASGARHTTPSVSALQSNPVHRADAAGIEGKDTAVKKTYDCAICTETFQVPVIIRGSTPDDMQVSNSLASNARTETQGTSGAGASAMIAATATASAATSTLFARRAYMVTPCRHIFHTACLSNWLNYRLQCPICREALPPL